MFLRINNFRRQNKNGNGLKLLLAGVIAGNNIIRGSRFFIQVFGRNCRPS
jgi:hypothetical protein